MTTTSTSLGQKYGYTYVADAWYSHINNGEYTSAQESALVDALVQSQVDEFEALLPDSHYWLIHTSELQYPVEDDTETGDLDALMDTAVQRVSARLPQIEAEVLADRG